MFCPNCGKEVNGGKFCPSCGTVLPEGAASPAPGGNMPPEAAWSGNSYTPPPAPGASPIYTAPPQGTVPAGGGKKRTGLIVGCVAGVAALAVLAVVLVLNVFASPKERVEKAAVKSTAAFASAWGQLELPDLAQLSQNRSYSQRFSLELDSISPDLSGGYDLSSLSGLGLRIDAGYDQKSRKMGAELKAYLGSTDLASFQLQADDSILSIASPEFTQGNVYGLNTETLGADLVRLGAEDGTGELKNLSFNLFDLVETFSLSEAQTKELEQAVREAHAQLWEQAEVEKAGKQTIQVNGNSLDAELYRVTLPQQAVRDWLDAMKPAIESMNSLDSAKKMLQAMGFSQNYIDQAMAGADTAGMYDEMFDSLKEQIDSDLVLDVYLFDGHVAALEFSESSSDGIQRKLGLYLGGSENYADDLGLVYTEDGKEVFRLSSSGSHAPKDGVFTDTTELAVFDAGTTTRLTSTLRYEPKAKNNNFSWELNMGGVGGVSAAGQVTANKTSLEAQLDEFAVMVGGARLANLKVNYRMGPYDKPAFVLSSPKLLAGMTEEDIMGLYSDLMNNTISWIKYLTEVLPEELTQLLYYM